MDFKWRVVVNAGSDDTKQAQLVDKAIGLFTFLGRAQEMLAKPVRQVSAYEKVIWFGDLPEHRAVKSAHRIGELEVDIPLLTVDRVSRIGPPKIPEILSGWVDGAIDAPDNPPGLKTAIYVNQSLSSAIETPHLVEPEDSDPSNSESVTVQRLELNDAPEVKLSFLDWMVTWDLWAEQERENRRAREIYQDLFSTHLAATGHAEEFELVIGIGCLTWTPQGHEPVLRHLATAPISISLDDSTGSLTVEAEQSIDAITIELDMLDPRLITSPAKVDEIRRIAREYDGHLLDSQSVGDVCRRLVHRLDANSAYDDEETDPPTGTGPLAHFAPAIILRKRSSRGLIEIYKTIVEQIRASGEVPSGVIPMIDPDHRPAFAEDTQPGAIVPMEDESFLPLPMNEVQLRIVKRVNTTAQTLVQGPPGTGKTHTAAALVSHLLAQGKRVLITAHTERALYEVRDKLPPAVRPLAVSVIGKSRADMSDLKVAVEQISSRAADFDVEVSHNAIETRLKKIDRLRRERAEIFTKLFSARGAEVELHEFGSHEWSLSRIALDHLEGSSQHGWISEFSVTSKGAEAPMTNEEILCWLGYLLDEQLLADESESQGRISALDVSPLPEEFASLIHREAEASAVAEQYRNLLSHDFFAFVSSLEPPVREELRNRVGSLSDEAVELDKRREPWINDALTDVRSGRSSTWVSRRREIGRIAALVEPLIARIGFSSLIRVEDGVDVDVCRTLAHSLISHLDSGGKIKTLPDGSPKIGPFASKAVKSAEPLFTGVRVDGLPPTTVQQLSIFLDWVEATKLLAAIGNAWPSGMATPDEDTLREELQWHLTEIEQLDRALKLGERLERERDWFEANRLPKPDWNNLDEIRQYAQLVEAAAAQDDQSAARMPLLDLESRLAAETEWRDAPPCVANLLGAVHQRNLDLYVQSHERLGRLLTVATMASERDRLAKALAVRAPALKSAIQTSPFDEEWADRLASFEASWEWDRTGKWILDQDSVDVNVLQQQLSVIENQIRSEVGYLAAERAWGHAISPNRLSGRSRADLTQYAQLVSRLGKGTGKYAAKQRAEIRSAMDRCSPAVPVWIMPIYRIAEQLRIQPDRYDVVIVDEASQAGLAATFLQYLAPKMVVIGDDKQVSPSAVGVDQQQLRDLANQYLATDTYRASWQDPKRSLFDEAKMRFGGVLTLTEHRRCVPEIIGFSNRIAYEPEGIRLVPVRQYGAERLEPIKCIHITDGYEGANKTNPAEADAIVSQIEKCFTDPRYDGCTFGVVSLLGKQQAQLIEHKLLELIPPEEWSARDLRCGDATDFQGSERDVMFLSMVKAVLPGERLYSMTKQDAVQRFNVAASRAKDQMWVYHSMPKDALTNPEDMRFQLLDYCYGVIGRLKSDTEGAVSSAVPEDVRVPPFDSLFEQRVFNRLIDRGFTVVPQFDANGYHIDLVIIGAKGRLAIECDGDFWHGPDVYERDLSRQRDLERCGWEFFRVRESVFYADMAAALSGLWTLLDELQIRPSDWIDADDTPDLPTEIEPQSDAFDGISSDPVETPADVEVVGRHRGLSSSPESMMTAGSTDSTAPEVSHGESNSLPLPESVATNQPEPTPVAVSTIGLLHYIEFSESLRPVGEDGVDVTAQNIARIVAAEGPVLGRRLHTAYVRATGGQRVGKEIARQLNRAITLAEKRGAIVADNPLNQAGIKPKVYRLPEQPNVTVRTLGPRSLHHVPVTELAQLIEQELSLDSDTAEEEIFREVLTRLGLKGLTENAREALIQALNLTTWQSNND